MEFAPTAVPGVFVLSSEIHRDMRGSFQRSYCSADFADRDLEPVEVQSAISRNKAKATLRGLHFIPEGDGEAKLVRCIAGRIFDVAVDLRPDSPAYLQYVAIELDAELGNALYLPRGVAHGFLTLCDHCDVLYQFSRAYSPGVEQGVRWDDPAISIAWPLKPQILSDRDHSLPYAKDLSRA